MGTCTAADACAQVCGTSTLSHPCIPPTLKFLVDAEISLQHCAHALRDTGTSTMSSAFPTGRAGCVKSALGAFA